MPFWWKRRRKPWFGRFRYRRYNKYKRRRRRLPRRRARRPFRRRRFRRKKRRVRKKLKKITIKQWQPDTVRKCKIKGFSCIVMGAQGTQFQCYTNQSSDYPQPKAPAGGGFGCEVINLKWLYKQYLAHNNIWTKSNQYLDLCRYTGCKITLYRHPTVDFIIAYDTQPPFDLNIYTYPEIQPQNMLLRRHKKILLSKQSNPKGRLKLTLKIHPPKQMITKWFFQRDFCEANLVKLSAAAASFTYPGISHGAQSQTFTFYALNTDFYKQSDWGQTSANGYLPYTTIKQPIHFYYKEKGKTQVFSYTSNTSPPEGKTKYQMSIGYNTGLFSPKALFAYQVVLGGTNPQPPNYDIPSGGQLIANLPLIALRYNPHEDTGHGNEVYLTSIVTGHYDKPSVTPSLYLPNIPLWMAFYGYWDFILQDTKNKGVYDTHMFVVKSPAIKTLGQTTDQSHYPIIDMDYGAGKLPWDEFLSQRQKDNWFPTAEWQKITINNFVTSGPYMPKFEPGDRDSTWQLNYKYQFFFKWGGPQTTDPAVEDPCSRKKYPTPDTLKQTIQISNPEKLHTDSILHDWDFRRGIVTQTALKRMSENLQTDSSFESDDSETPKKKQKVSKELQTTENKQEKIKKCLLSLCEEPTCQDPKEDLQQLIQQQQLQQQQLKRNLFKLLTHLKKSQRLSDLQTGLLE
nr:MAG: ORF1 [Torque teno midi virus]